MNDDARHSVELFDLYISYLSDIQTKHDICEIGNSTVKSIAKALKDDHEALVLFLVSILSAYFRSYNDIVSDDPEIIGAAWCNHVEQLRESLIRYAENKERETA